MTWSPIAAKGLSFAYGNGWLWIGPALVYGQGAWAFGLYWNRRCRITGRETPAGEFRHADHIVFIWFGRSRDGRWWTANRFKMSWNEVSR